MNRLNYFETLGLRMEDVHGGEETEIRKKIRDAWDTHDRKAARAGARTRKDGRTQREWRELLQTARDVLLDPEKRREHVRELRPPEPEPKPVPKPGHDPEPRGDQVGDYRARQTVEGAAVGMAASVLYLVAVLEGANTAAQFVAFAVGFLATLILLTAKFPSVPGFGKFFFSAVAGGLAVAWLYVARLSFEMLSSALPQEASMALSVSAFAFVGAALGGVGLMQGMHQRLSLGRTSNRGAIAMMLLTIIPCVILAAGAGGPPRREAGEVADSEGVSSELPADTEEVGGTSEGGSTPEGSAYPPPAVSNVVPLGATEAAQSFDRSAWRRIQGGLKAAGFYPGAIDGLLGPGTLGAIRNWQTARGAEATGDLEAAQAEELMALGEPNDAAPGPANVATTDAGAGRLTVRAEPGSRIDLDGVESGTTDEAGILVLSGIQAGRHFVVAHHQGYESSTGVVDVASGRSEVVELVQSALPGTLTVSANVADATLVVEGVGAYSLPLTRVEVPPGSRRLTATKSGFRSVENDVEIRPGESMTLDVVLERLPIDELLRGARRQFDAGRYADAAASALAVLDIFPEAGEAHLLVGRALYELGRFDDGAISLALAIAFGQQVALATKHRHGGLGLREGFCAGTISVSREGVSYRSNSERDHDFFVAPNQILNLEQQVTRGSVLRIDTRIVEMNQGRERRRNFDFVHKDTVREQNPQSELYTILSCQNCDASMNVQATLMEYVNRQGR